MRFWSRWVFREFRNDASWVLLFVFCLSIGLFGFLLVESFKQGLEKSLNQQAKNFLSADFSVSSRRKISDEELVRIRAGLNIKKESHLTELFSMLATKTGDSRLVQLKSIDDEYPLYGELKFSSGRTHSSNQKRTLSERAEVWVYPDLLTTLNLKIGDSIKIGSKEFMIADAIEDDSTQVFKLAGLAPKVYLSQKYLAETELIGFGTTSTDSYLFQLKGEGLAKLQGLVKKFEKEFIDPNLQFSSPLDQAQDSTRVLRYLLDYLGLVSLVGMALSLVGISYLIQLFLSRRLKTWCLLQTLGLTQVKTLNFFIFEICLFGLMSCLLVIPFLGISQPILSTVLKSYFAFDFAFKISANLILQSILLSMVLPAFIALPILKQISRVSIKEVLIENKIWIFSSDKKILIWWLPSVFIFSGLSLWSSHSVRTTLIFLTLLLVGATFVLILSWCFLRLASSIRGDWRWQQVIKRVSREPMRFSVVILSLAFGTFLLVLVPQLQNSLSKELFGLGSAQVPDLFLFDIQDEQIEVLKNDLSEQSLIAQNPSSLIRARIISINGQSFERTVDVSQLQTREQETEARFRNRGVNLTIRQELSSSESITHGRPFSTVVTESAEVSIEAQYAERLGIALGDRITFDVQGLEVQAHVVSLRTVQWNSFQPNFFITFQAGHLEEAPKTWIFSLPKMSDEKKQKIQSFVVQKFPNISIIDVGRLIQKTLDLSKQMSAALILMAILSVFVGLFVLATVLVLESRARRLEWNLYKILGASHQQIQVIFMTENLLVTVTAILLGSMLGVVSAAILLKVIFNFILSIAWIPLVASAVLLLLTVWLLGWMIQRNLMHEQVSELLSSSRS